MDTPAAAAISATVVSSYPFSSNNRMAAPTSACRVWRRLRSRNPASLAMPYLQKIYTQYNIILDVVSSARVPKPEGLTSGTFTPPAPG